MKSPSLHFFFSFLFLGLVFSEIAAAEHTNAFEANGVLWIVKLGELDSYDSEVASSALQVSSDSQVSGFAQPAWIGNDPGDLGPLWFIQDEDQEVMGACWVFYDNPTLHCVPLYVFPTLSLDEVPQIGSLTY